MTNPAEPSFIATNRLYKEFMQLKEDPIPYVTAALCDSNILECHYVIEGPPDSLYSGGYYHGKLIFPPEYPFKPPAIYMITPNGRFQVNVRLCLSISDYHPSTWNPAWTIGSILVGLLSFMKKKLAQTSWRFNLRNETFCQLFPEISQRLNTLCQNATKSSTTVSSQILSSIASNLSTRLANLKN